MSSAGLPSWESLRSGPATHVPIERVRPADSPRRSGEDHAHIRLLAEAETTLPPVVVHRATMRVIDGMHRLRAARMRGVSSIEVVYFDGTAEDAFVLSVQSNITHGLPLTLEDRTAAAARIIGEHPHWSNRRIASVSGLSAATVGSIRRRSTDQNTQSNSRVGTDGRVRPLRSAAGRLRAEWLFTHQPTSSLREVAREAGISPATAQDVRRRMVAGEHPVPPGQRTGSEPASGPAGRAARTATVAGQADEPTRGTVEASRRTRRTAATATGGTPASSASVGPVAPAPTGTVLPSRPRRPAGHTAAGAGDGLERLRRDPSLRSTEIGRSLLRSIGSGLLPPQRQEAFVRAVPPYCRDLVAQLAEDAATSWQEMADRVRAQSGP